MKKFFAVLIVLALAATTVFLGYSLYNSKREIENYQKTIETLTFAEGTFEERDPLVVS